LFDLNLILIVLCFFSFLGIIFLIILYIKILFLKKELNFHKFESKLSGVSDLLNYASVVDNGIIVCKNGSLMAGWKYKGKDCASLTDEEREQTSFYLNQILSQLGNGWMLHVDAVRFASQDYFASEESFFPDFLSSSIEEERREFFTKDITLYEGFFVLTVTWFPPLLAQRKFLQLMFEDELNLKLSKKQKTYHLIDDFKKEIRKIEQLSSILELTRLCNKKNEDTFLSWLHFCITGLNSPIKLPKHPIYLDSYLGGQELWGGIIPKIGKKYIKIVTIEGFPSEGYPGIFSMLAELSLEYRWSSRFIFMEEYEALKHLNKLRKKWKQKIRGFLDQVFYTNNGPIDQHAVSMVEDAEEAISEVNSRSIAFGYYTTVLVLMDDDRMQLEKGVDNVEKMIQNLGCIARTETVNTLEAFLGSLPGHGLENVRRPLIHTMNFADLIPISSLWLGNIRAPCPLYSSSPALMKCVTHGQTPFYLNLHVDDVGHTLMIGPTGSGKSTHLGLIAAQLRRYKDFSLYSFDKGLSLYPLTKAVNGQHFALFSDKESLSFCPLQFLATKGDQAWAQEWIEMILELNGLSINPSQRNDILFALKSMAQSGSKTLSDFLLTIQDERIREGIKPYTTEGPMGSLLDSDHDGLFLSKFATFEIEELMNLEKKFAVPILLYLFRRIELSLVGQPAAILLDEAWLLLDHPIFRAKIKEWLKVLRKANCLVLLATQNLSDAYQSDIFDVILESTATKIFLPNLYAMESRTKSFYEGMGLHLRQIEMLAQAIPKCHYLYASEEGCRLYELVLGPIARTFLGKTDKNSILRIRSLEAQYGEAWISEWLRLNLNE
jgi:type IV secretion system protein VirB4